MTNLPGTSLDSASAGQSYLNIVQRLIHRLTTEEWGNIARAATAIATSLRGGGTLHACGTGHSLMVAEEFYYRAGGLVRYNPIFFDGVGVRSNARLSTTLERLPGLAEALLQHEPIAEGDVAIVASNSGSNAVTRELAAGLQARGVQVIAITSITHATSTAARATDSKRLHEFADIVIDNGGAVGDAAIAIEGMPRKVAPTSTVVAAALVNAIVAETTQQLVASGFIPEVYLSSNIAAGDAANASYHDVQ